MNLINSIKTAILYNNTTLGLGYWTEQALESVHQDFGQFWEKRKVGIHHESYQQNILESVCAYNKKHF